MCTQHRKTNKTGLGLASCPALFGLHMVTEKRVSAASLGLLSGEEAVPSSHRARDHVELRGYKCLFQ